MIRMIRMTVGGLTAARRAEHASADGGTKAPETAPQARLPSLIRAGVLRARFAARTP